MGKHANGSTRRKIREAARSGEPVVRLSTPRENATSRAIAVAIKNTSWQERDRNKTAESEP